MTRDPPGVGPIRPREILILSVALVAVSAWWLWPLPTVARSHLPNLGASNPLVLADLHLLIWALRWTSTALVSDPSSLLAGNAFFPSEASIAYSEHMLGYLPLFAPTYFATGSQALSMNVLLLLLFPLRGLAMYCLARAFVPAYGATIAAFLYAFPPEARADLMKFHIYGVVGLPIAIWASERWIAEARLRHLVLLTLALVLQAAASFYLAYAQVFAYGAYLSVALLLSRAELDRRRLVGLAGAGAVVGAAIVLLGLPYLSLRNEGVIPSYSNSVFVPVGLRPGVASRYLWGYLVGGGVGVFGYALAVLGAPPLSFKRASLLGLGITAVGMIVAAGPAPAILGVSVWSPYELLADLLPGFSTIRQPSRFTVICHLGICLLAAVGAARLIAWIPATTLRWPLTVGATALSLWLAWPSPLPTAPHPLAGGTPPAYAWLKENATDGRALIELPRPSWGEAAARMYASPAHGLPIVDGYSGHPIESDDFLHDIAQTLPHEGALQLLTDLVDVGWLIVNLDRVPPSVAARFEGPLPPGLERVGRFGDQLLLQITRPVQVDRRDLFLSTTKTLGGLDRSSVLEECPGTLRVGAAPPQPWAPGAHLPIDLLVSNDGTRAWPAAGVVPKGLVRLHACFVAADGSGCRDTATRIPIDLPPGQTASVRPVLFAPRREGAYTLKAWLVQEELGDLEPCGVDALEVPVTVTRR